MHPTQPSKPTHTPPPECTLNEINAEPWYDGTNEAQVMLCTIKCILNLYPAPISQGSKCDEGHIIK